jgi:hypothetical protein
VPADPPQMGHCRLACRSINTLQVEVFRVTRSICDAGFGIAMTANSRSWNGWRPIIGPSEFIDSKPIICIRFTFRDRADQRVLITERRRVCYSSPLKVLSAIQATTQQFEKPGTETCSPDSRSAYHPSRQPFPPESELRSSGDPLQSSKAGHIRKILHVQVPLDS